MGNKDLETRMDRVIEWVKTCDTKASFLLMIEGFLVAILFSSEYVLKVVSYLYVVLASGTPEGAKPIPCPVVCVSVLSLLVLIICIIVSIFYLINVLGAKTKENLTGQTGVRTNSLIHFNHISTKSYTDFRASIDSETDNDAAEDLKSQLYINSVRCAEKFKDYNTSIIFLKIAVIAMLVFIAAIVVLATYMPQ